MNNKIRIGLIVNPVAGLGGSVGLKGSDLPDIIERSAALGGKPQALARARHALEQLLDVRDRFCFLAYEDEMGGELALELGFDTEIIGAPMGSRSSAQDTVNAAKLIASKAAKLIVFAGGDGTARNICAAIGDCVPVIGIPAGVKIHSAVYAINPRNAGLAIRDHIEGKPMRLRESEVMDIDEEVFRNGRVSARLYGYMRTPEDRGRMQNMKSGGYSEDGELAGMAGYVVCNMDPDTTYIIGPGSTTKAVMDDLGIANSLLGVDVIKGGRLVASDVSENRLWELIEDSSIKVNIIMTLIGGQGSLFGRGNQQLSPRVIRRVGKEGLIVVSTTSKIISFRGAPLVVDTGDPELDAELAGFIEVFIAFGQTTYMTVVC
jgi:predicted polyphosphate/ATP-dependent NAD kinase